MHTRYFKVAGITVRLDAELPIAPDTFAPKFTLFETDGPGADTVHLVHRFSLPDMDRSFGRQVYRKPPWVIYRDADRWVYVLEAASDPDNPLVRQVSFARLDHTRVDIHNSDLGRKAFEAGHLGALTMTPTDQILLAALLADRSGCYLHSDGVNMGGKGFLFVGHSGAGKSTIATQLKDRCEILCDDRMIVRKWDGRFFIHGNWSHGTMPVVSAGSAPLSGIFFLEQADENRIVPVKNRMEIITKLLACLIKPLVTKEWWEKMLTLVEDLADSVPCRRLRFDRSGDVYRILKDF